MIGTRLGHFRILEQVGAGGMGEVYRAHDEHLDRSVAIKVLPTGTLSDPESRRRLHDEALTLSKLNHPHIATVYDFDTQDGIDFLAMEFIEGKTLRQMLSSGPLSQEEIVELALQLLDGLDAAHRQGIVHCDLKPENLRVTSEHQLKILDFGLATLTRPAGDASTTQAVGESHHLEGTLPYMSPEQVRDQNVDAQSDIYAAGAVLYEMATGQRPFSDPAVPALIDAILHGTPRAVRTLNPKIDRNLESVIHKALQRDRVKRYRAASAFLSDLETRTRAHIGMRPSGRALSFSLFAASLLLVVSVVWTPWSTDAPAFEERDWIFIADVVNATDDPIFDEALETAISIDIRQSQWVRVVSPSMTANILQFMKKPDVEFIDEKLGIEICRRGAVKVMLVPSIHQIAGAYQLAARLVRVDDGLELSAARVTSRSREAILEDGVDELVKTIRGALGESLSAIDAADLPIDQATTSSWEALREYAIGNRLHLEFRLDDARHHLERAVELDSTFVAALSLLGILSAYHGDEEAAIRYHTCALRHSESVSQRERLGTRAIYYLQVEHDAEKAVAELEASCRIHPGEAGVLNNLSVIYREFFRDYAKALDYAESAIEVDPYSMVYYNAFSMAANFQGYFDETFRMCARQRDINPQHVWAYVNAAEAYAAIGEVDRALVDLRQGLAIDPSNSFGRLLEVHLLRMKGEVHAALSALGALEAMSAHNPSTVYEKAALLFRCGDEMAAHATLDTLESICRGSAMAEEEARRWRALIAARRGEREAAVSETESLVLSEDAADLLTVARIHALAEDAEQSVAWLERAVTIEDYGVLEIYRMADFDPIRSTPQYRDFVGRQIKTRSRPRV